MKIIGTKPGAYLCEVTKKEMTILTGREESYSNNNHSHNSGTEVNVIPISDHAKDMERTIPQRKHAAQLLRACADIIETVPPVFEPPPEVAAADLSETGS